MQNQLEINCNTLTRTVFTVQDVQSILGLGKNKTYELCTSGAFVHKRVGRTILIPKKTFWEWLESN